ncbi:hypothetical protein THTE_0165 [Thermogutta terrifontis]|uniref:Uncharacterized protein n=1 Tax=Thermogutta terrifontis TaxID=1331910 RepID=A0A286RA13_9BACT|nr:hypothetical protein THTE_0165 [Thermogutta terrifontis]
MGDQREKGGKCDEGIEFNYSFFIPHFGNLKKGIRFGDWCIDRAARHFRNAR